MFGIEAAVNYVSLGLWQEANDLHWRVDGSSQVDWTGTDWTIDAPASQNFAVAIGDMTQRNSIAAAWFNGASAGTRTYVGPEVDNHRSTSRFGLGDADYLGSDADCYATELHLFDSTAAATSDEIAYVDASLKEVQTVSNFGYPEAFTDVGAGNTTSNVGDIALVRGFRYLANVVSAEAPSPSAVNWIKLGMVEFVTDAETATTYTVVDSDLAGNVLKEMDNATAITVTVAPSLTGTEPATFIQKGVGMVTFVAGAGVTINSPNGNLKMGGQFASVSLIPDKSLADTFYLIGSLIS
jgi:hypothetical protein